MPTIIQWVNHLAAQIDEQTEYAKQYEARYRNEHVLPFIQREYAEVYGSGPVERALSGPEAPRAGTAAVVVDALSDRLVVIGATSQDADAAKVVEAAWLENDFDVMHREGHREALIKRVAFGQVSRSADGERAILSVDTAEQMAVHRESGPPYDVDAALKVAVDEWTGRRSAHLWLPGRNVRLTEAASATPDPEGSGVSSRWVVTGEEASGFSRVPVVELPSRPRLIAKPVSEIETIRTHVDMIDLIDGLMVFAGHFGAVPIRYGTGLTIPRDPKDPTKPLLGPDGKPMLGFDYRADRMWVSTNDDARFGQLTPAGLDSFVAWAQHAASRIRAKTGVASTYLSLELKSHMSAELLKTDEAPMVRRVRSMGERGVFNQAWRRLNGLILEVESPNSRAVVQPRWEDPQTRVETQDADVFAKLAPHLGAATLAQEVLGWSPQEATDGVAEAERARLEIQSGDPLAGISRRLMAGSTDAARGDG